MFGSYFNATLARFKHVEAPMKSLLIPNNLNFNATLARFKRPVSVHSIHKCTEMHFNATLARFKLEAPVRALLIPDSLNFNATLARFKQKLQKLYFKKRMSDQFQCYFSTI